MPRDTQNRIMIVDDEVRNCQLYTALLKAWGHEVITATEGQEALRLMQEHPIDLALVDVMMPGIDGLQLTRSIKADPACAHIPVILVTALHDREVMMEGLDAGAEEFLTRPVEKMELQLRVENLLRLKKLSDQLRIQAEELAATRERYQLALRGSNDGIWDWDLLNQQCFYSSRWFEQLEIHDQGEHTPQTWFDRVYEPDRKRLSLAIRNYLQGGEWHFECEYRIRSGSGAHRWMIARGMATFDEHGNPLRFAGSQTDMTERRLRDPLTGLPIREVFCQALEQALIRSQRRSHYNFAILLLDIDRLKRVNAALGFEAGDQVLLQISQRLQKFLRVTDNLCRLGADKFGVLLEDLQQPDHARKVAEKLKEHLEKSFQLGNQELVVQVSMGLVSCPNTETDADAMLSMGEKALYEAKQQKRGRLVEKRCTEEEPSMSENLRLEVLLHQAVVSQSLEAHFQPILDLHHKKVCGCEALIRWKIDNEYISPQRFIPLAEENGLIVDIGRWMIRASLQQLQAWRDNHVITNDFFISVNLSTPEFEEETLLPYICSLLEEYQIPASMLALELTESVLMLDPVYIKEILDKLSALGLRLYLDDFGTGYSSLSYFSDLRFL